MRKIKILLLIIVALFQSCKEDVPQKMESIAPKIKLSENFCYINKIEQNDGKVSAAIDFIEYSKTTDLDSTILSSSIIELPNGFCYSNKEVKNEEVEFKNNSKIIMQTFSYSKEGNFNFNQAVTLDEFVQKCNTTEPKPFMFSPYKIVLNKSNIITLTEIYIP